MASSDPRLVYKTDKRAVSGEMALCRENFGGMKE